MEVIIFEKAAYYRMLSELMNLFKETLKNAKSEIHTISQNDWIDQEEAKQLLNIKSKTTMQQLRSTGAIAFSKYGKKIKYSRKSILNYLEQYKIASV